MYSAERQFPTPAHSGKAGTRGNVPRNEGSKETNAETDVGVIIRIVKDLEIISIKVFSGKSTDRRWRKDRNSLEMKMTF